MKCKVLIDSVSLLSPLTGVGRYTYEIAKILRGSEDYDIEYFYGYYSKKLRNPLVEQNSLKSFVVKNSFLKKIVRKIINFGSKIFASNYDLYWQPNFIPNSGIRAKKVITTIHDFSFMLHNDFHPQERVAYFKENFFQNSLKSDFIITGSYFTKSEIVNRLDISEDRVKVIYHGIDHNVFKPMLDLELSFKLPEKFLLSVGSIEPRKNLIGLLKAYNLLDDKIKSVYKLVLVGFKGWNNKEILALLEENSMNITYIGFISDEELAKVYNRASLFLFVSFYEGFGIPPLEAFACKTPVIASNRSSIPEVLW